MRYVKTGSVVSKLAAGAGGEAVIALDLFDDSFETDKQRRATLHVVFTDDKVGTIIRMWLAGISFEQIGRYMEFVS